MSAPPPPVTLVCHRYATTEVEASRSSTIGISSSGSCSHSPCSEEAMLLNLRLNDWPSRHALGGVW
jgi:hypothetical protein